MGQLVREDGVGYKGSRGKVVGFGESRPIHYDRNMKQIFSGDILSYLDVLLVNSRGEKKLVRFPISQDVRDFYTRAPISKPRESKKTARKR